MYFLFTILRRKNYAWKSTKLKYCVTFQILFLIYIFTKSNESNSNSCMIVTTRPLVHYLLQQPVNTFLVLGDRCASSSVSPIKSGAFSFTRKQKKIPAALKEARNYLSVQLSNFSCSENMKWLTFSHFFFQVSANTENSSMSGYLNRSKGNKKQWKRLWFVIKNKVLYTYAASEVRTLCDFSNDFLSS